MSTLKKPSPERSRQMALVRGRGNKSTERQFVKILRSWKIRGWRSHAPLPGRPDLVFPKAKVAIFVDGCFWHGCPRCYRQPKSNVAFWKNKVRRNMERDRRVVRQLRKNGWKVVRIWEHALKQGMALESRIRHALSRTCRRLQPALLGDPQPRARRNQA